MLCVVFLSLLHSSFLYSFLSVSSSSSTSFCSFAQKERMSAGLICDQGLQGKRAIYLQEVLL